MRHTGSFVCVVLLIGINAALARQQDNKDSGKAQNADAAPAPIPQEAAEKKNPVKPNAEGLAAARKLYGYDCEMCHGKDGGGKGDLADDMKLQLKDWRDGASISEYTDGALFYIISNGRGKMMGEGDRTGETARWNLVNLVRSFAKKTDQAAKQP
jgi:mono/diheme cytochrome c family protein